MRDTSSLIKRRKEDVFCMGYFLDTVTDFTPDLQTTPQSYPVYGSDDNMVGLTVDGGSLSLTFLAKDENNNSFLDLITNQDPTDGSFKVYSWNQATTPVSVWVNRKSNDGTRYKGGILFKNFQPDAGMPAGAPADDATRTFAGNCTAPTEIASGGIFGQMIDCTPTGYGNLSFYPMEITAGVSGLQIIAIQDSTATNYVTEDVALAANIFNGAATSGINGQYVLSGCSNITTFDKVYVIYAISSGGIYPNSPYLPATMQYGDRG